MTTQTRTQTIAAASGLALLLLACGCGGAKPKSEVAGNNAPTPQQADASGGAAASDDSKLDAEIERLEKLAERSPGDQDGRGELARAYVRRGDWMRGAGRLREALLDYQRALRLDPDNDAAQKNAAETKEQLGGAEQEDENGAPAPLPITPNVADDEGKPMPTPKKP
ncbi:MAG TPA: tetratricopeptide repeat protein [Pyrinomonadaceae bacterium]|nr:tetratricopeptide repeat protein [Pyrinomonadaceae bacterium]